MGHMEDPKDSKDPKGGTDPVGMVRTSGGDVAVTSTIDPDTGKPRCTAHSRTSGERCKQRPVLGTTVCVYHGGKAPQVQRKAKLRLLALVDPAIATMARVMATADKDADKLRAAENILDRTGFARRVEVDAETAKEQLMFRLEQLREQREGETQP